MSTSDLTKPSSGLAQDIRETFQLALPLCAAYAGTQLLGLVDLAVVGRLDATAIAGASVGNAIFFVASILGIGTLMGLDPLVSQAIGGGRPDKARHYLGHGLQLSVWMFIPLTLLMFVGWWLLLGPAGIKPDVQTSTLYYLAGRVPSLLFNFLFIAMRCYLQSMAITRPIITSTIIANIVNVPLSLFLALGDQGMEIMGLPGIGFAGWGVFGAALGTSIVTLVQMLTIGWEVKRIAPAPTGEDDTKAGILVLLGLGFPIALQLVAEGGLFSTVTLLMGSFGKDYLGGHQVALHLASFTFMICMGLSSATCVRVGHAVGRKDPQGTIRAGFIGIIAGAFLMSCSAFGLWLFADVIAAWFAKPPGVVAAATLFLGIAAIFQFFDGIQAVAGGAIRGTGNTRLPFVLNVISHWCIGMPIAVYFAFYTKLGAIGLWWGLTGGLISGSITLTAAFIWQVKRKI